jgi:predicted ATPase
MSHAAEGEILTVPEVLERSRTLFNAQRLESFHVKGKRKSISALAVQSTYRGERVVVHLTGPTGIGKSRLVDELQLQSSAFRVHKTRCEHYETSNAYFPMRQLLRSALDIQATDPQGIAGELQRSVSSRAPQLLDWLPLIASVLDVWVPQTDAVDRLPPRFRRNQLHRSIRTLVAAVCDHPSFCR